VLLTRFLGNGRDFGEKDIWVGWKRENGGTEAVGLMTKRAASQTHHSRDRRLAAASDASEVN
jgi:hypothetical protein